MAEPIPRIPGHPRYDPTKVAEASFDTVRRGFDEVQVRSFLGDLAASMRASYAVEDRLRKELARLEARVEGAETIDDTLLVERLGEEAAKILNAAREAAAERLQKADEQASATAERAYRNASEVRARADRALQEKLAEAEAQAAAVLAESEGLIEAARAEAEAIVEDARTQGRQMIDETVQHREQMLQSMERRRQRARIQVERLQAGRDRLLASYQVVQRTLDEARSELEVSVPEAKIAAARAARRLEDEAPRTAAELEAELESARLAGLVGTDAPVEPADPEPEPVAEELGHDETVPEPEPVAAETVPEEPEPEPGPVAAETVPEEPEPAAGPAAEEPAHDETEPQEPEPVPDEPEPVAEERLAEETGPEPVAEERLAEEAGPEATDPGEPGPEATDPGEPGPEATDAEEPQRVPPGTASRVDDLFAQLRGGAERPGSAPAPASPDRAGLSESERAETLARRDEVLDPIAATMTRDLKRAMSRSQNDLLDLLRRGSLGDLTEVDAPVVAAAEAALAVAWTEGARFYGFEAPAPDHPDDLGSGFVDGFVTPLKLALADCLSGGGDVAEAIRTVFRGHRGDPLVAQVAEATTAAFVRGIYDAAPKRRPMFWVPDEAAAPCPAAAANVAAGAVRRGEHFPSGTAHPPAAPGCRCLLKPADQ